VDTAVAVILTTITFARGTHDPADSVLLCNDDLLSDPVLHIPLATALQLCYPALCAVLPSDPDDGLGAGWDERCAPFWTSHCSIDSAVYNILCYTTYTTWASPKLSCCQYCSPCLSRHTLTYTADSSHTLQSLCAARYDAVFDRVRTALYMPRALEDTAWGQATIQRFLVSGDVAALTAGVGSLCCTVEKSGLSTAVAQALRNTAVTTVCRVLRILMSDYWLFFAGRADSLGPTIDAYARLVGQYRDEATVRNPLPPAHASVN
jgi:hypothetical protein